MTQHMSQLSWHKPRVRPSCGTTHPDKLLYAPKTSYLWSSQTSPAGNLLLPLSFLFQRLPDFQPAQLPQEQRGTSGGCQITSRHDYARHLQRAWSHQPESLPAPSNTQTPISAPSNKDDTALVITGLGSQVPEQPPIQISATRFWGLYFHRCCENITDVGAKNPPQL